MTWIAIKMLVGCHSKFLGLLSGVAFASLLIAQQSSIFCGVMLSTTGQIHDVRDSEIWVMDPSVEVMGPVKPLRDADVNRVASVPGVKWAVPFYKGSGLAESDEGKVHDVILQGIDDATLVGAPRTMVVGSWEDLRHPNAILIDETGYHEMWPNEPIETGRHVTLNDARRFVVRGICKASQVFQTRPIIYTRLSQIDSLVAPGTGTTSFVLANTHSGISPKDVARNIETSTGLKARSRADFKWMTLRHVLLNTGIPANFAITVGLGFLVGILVSGQTFYLVTLENLPLFGTLKALGTTNGQIVGMILLQAVVVGACGYAIGVGLAAQFGELTRGHTRLMFHMPWEILVGTGVSVLMMILAASLLSIRRVLVLEPAIVFRGDR